MPPCIESSAPSSSGLALRRWTSSKEETWKEIWLKIIINAPSTARHEFQEMLYIFEIRRNENPAITYYSTSLWSLMFSLTCGKCTLQVEISSIYYSPLCGWSFWWHFLQLRNPSRVSGRERIPLSANARQADGSPVLPQLAAEQQKHNSFLTWTPRF